MHSSPAEGFPARHGPEARALALARLAEDFGSKRSNQTAANNLLRGQVCSPSSWRMPSSQRISCFSSTSRDALNYCHLVDAGLPALLDKYIAECLHRGQNDWLTKDTCNVVALFGHMTSQGVFYNRTRRW
jgi:hypothetical protein